MAETILLRSAYLFPAHYPFAMEGGHYKWLVVYRTQNN